MPMAEMCVAFNDDVYQYYWDQLQSASPDGPLVIGNGVPLLTREQHELLIGTFIQNYAQIRADPAYQVQWLSNRLDPFEYFLHTLAEKADLYGIKLEIAQTLQHAFGIETREVDNKFSGYKNEDFEKWWQNFRQIIIKVS
jgi:hypothetical protein